MSLKEIISVYAPGPIQTLLRDIYYGVTSETDPRKARQRWREQFENWDMYCRELDEHGLEELADTMDSLQHSGDIDLESLKDLYALIRSESPNTVIETGVCNGTSTWIITHALEENGDGHLYSIDLPFYSDMSLEEQKRRTFEGVGRSMIPADKGPGWVVPDTLSDRWTLHEGKSQFILPSVVESHPDVFLHDSEHSHPNMMFEMETAWQHMDSGYIICDDITWNDAFDIFTDIRADEWGYINRSMGYIVV